MFAKVPTEIFLIIRSYLVVCDYLFGLSSEAVIGFGNVFHVHITSCNNVIEFKSPQDKNNRILTFINCLGLRSLELSEQDYIQVMVRSCCGLDEFQIHGTVYSLDFTLNERWTKQCIPPRYQYLNGEEKEEEGVK
jgi:hypothetical protein